MRWLSSVLVVWLTGASQVAAQTPANVILVINDASPASVQVGEHYARARNLPADHIVRITAPDAETVQRADYARTIEAPIARWLADHSLQDQILYIVLTKGVPIRIAGTGGRNGTSGSVDSELTLLYRRMAGVDTSVIGRDPNPYYLGDGLMSQARRFSRHDHDIYLVTRLDGYTVEDVLKLIDRGLAPSTEGRIVLDQRAAFRDSGGDRWLDRAATRIEEMGAAGRVVFETTRELARVEEPVLGYYSWGSNDASNQLRGTGGLLLAPGALTGTFVSTDGRTFQEPPAEWRPGLSNRPTGVFGSGSQSMAADFIREGATGASAHVGEPYLDATIRPQILFPAYLSGFNLAESYYLAMPYLSWQTMIIGDPLVAPFQTQPVPDDQLHAGMDPDTELPALLSRRQVERIAVDGINEQSVKDMLRAGVELRRGDKPAAEASLQAAVEREPRLIAGSLQLASLYEERENYDGAIAEYRRIISVSPRNAVALNNLAYALAVRKQQAAEALPLALLAYQQSQAPTIADTVAWIHHLLGDSRSALPLIERAVAGSPNTPDIQLHAAFIHADLGQVTKARTALDAAVKLDPELATRPEVVALRQRVGGGQ